MLRTTWRDVSVVGEIARFDLRGGHGYFTLKDKTRDAAGHHLRLRPAARCRSGWSRGSRSSCAARLDLYAPQGKFQIKAFAARAGRTRRAAARLRAAQGAARGRGPLRPRAQARAPAPAAPDRDRHLARGGGVRDILNVLGRRFDGLAVTVYPGAGPGGARGGRDRRRRRGTSTAGAASTC